MSTASKAANGEGSIRKITQNGKARYVVEISLGYKPDGSRRRTRRTVDTYAQAKELRITLLGHKQKGLLTEQRLDTVRSFGIAWTDYKAERIRVSTAHDYLDRLNRYVFPYLGSVRLVDLTPDHVVRMMRTLADKQLSSSTINGARRVLSGLCKHAMRQGIIPNNPVTMTDPVRFQNEKTQVQPPWTLEETRRVLAEAEHVDDLDCFLHLMLHLGLRPGEALGLLWEDIDEITQRLHITGTLKAERRILPNERGIVRLTRNAPKTKSSRRTLDLTDSTLAALTRQRERQRDWANAAGTSWKTTGYVITTRVGTPVPASNLRKRYKALLARIGARYIRLHDLRHTVAHIALDLGVPIEQVSQALGHTRIDTTKQIYAGDVPMFTKNFVTVVSGALPTPDSLVIPDTVEHLERLWGPQPPAEL